MSRTRPLVYMLPGARADAARLLPDSRVIENTITAWITAGNVVSKGHAECIVVSPCGTFEACVFRVPGRFRPKPRAWLVHVIRPTRRKHRAQDPEVEVGREAVRPAART